MEQKFTDMNMKNLNLDYDSLFSVYKEHWVPRWSLNLEPKNWAMDKRPMRQDVDELLVDEIVDVGLFGLKKAKVEQTGK